MWFKGRRKSRSNNYSPFNEDKAKSINANHTMVAETVQLFTACQRKPLRNSKMCAWQISCLKLWLYKACCCCETVFHFVCVK